MTARRSGGLGPGVLVECSTGSGVFLAVGVREAVIGHRPRCTRQGLSIRYHAACVFAFLPTPLTQLSGPMDAAFLAND